MKKNLTLILSCAVSILGLVSCNNKEADLLKPSDKAHTVVFQAQNPAASETKTAMRLEVVFDWRQTDVKDVHIFETEKTSGSTYRTEADDVEMEIYGANYSQARFTATFNNVNAKLIPETTKATSSEFKYTAIMATREGEKYVVPSVQYPDAVAWFDPKADMLVGSDEETTPYSESLNEKELDLIFKRPVALARLAITNLEGTKVTKVKMTTENHITGYLTYEGIDFVNKKNQAFEGDKSNNELTILYPEGKEMDAPTFYAYFICVPGTIEFSKVEVYTDKYVFTKEYTTNPKLTFTANDFMNIALDLTPKDNNGVTQKPLSSQTLSFVDGNDQPVTSVEYDLHSSETFEAPMLVIGDDVADESKVEVSSSDEEIAIASLANGIVSVSFPGKTGEVTILATVPEDDTHAAGSASYKIIVSDSTPATSTTFYKADEIVANETYLIYSNGYILQNDNGSPVAVEVTVTDGVITLQDVPETVLWTATAASSGTFTIGNDGKYLYRGSSSSTAQLSSSSLEWTYDAENEFLNTEFKGSGSSTSTYCFYYSAKNTQYRISNQDSDHHAVLYTTTKPKTKRALEFSKESVTFDMEKDTETSFAFPTLSGITAGVTYSSSNTAVASVDKTSGKVTIIGVGTTVIKAEADATEEYKADSAEYTLKVVDGVSIFYEADEIVANETYLIYSNGYILQNDNGSPVAVEVTVTDGVITLQDVPETVLWTATAASSGTFTIGNDGKYLYRGSSSSTAQLSSSSLEWTYDAENEFLNTEFKGSGSSTSTYCFYYSAKNTQYRISNQDSDHHAVLYTTTKPKTKRALEFSKESVTFDMEKDTETSFAFPTLSGITAGVTYSSSNTAVATVDPTSGTVTIKGVGTTVIKAEADATEEYKADSAEYTLKVKNGDAKFKKANGIVAGKEYLIFSNGYIIQNNNSSTAGVVAVEVVDGVITLEDVPESVLWTATASSGAYTLKNGSYYLHHSSSSSGSYYKGELSSSSSSAWSYDASKNYLTTEISNTTYYFYYSAKNEQCRVGGKDDTDHIASLYVLDDGQSSDPTDQTDQTVPTMGSVEESFNLKVNNNTIVQELSGLCLSKDGDFLWGVGDKGTLYKINFDGTASIQWTSDSNMEGLAMDPNTGTMYMCYEPNNIYTLTGEYTSKTKLFDVEEAKSMNNSGVEGIAWRDGYLYLGAQTNATLWKYELNGTKVWKKELKSVVSKIKEVAGLDYDAENDWLWVLDSENMALYLLDGEATQLLATYDLSSIASKNPEGVAVDRKHNCIWIGEDYSSSTTPSKLHKIAFSNFGVE